MKLSELVKEILSEWEYRVDNGLPNPKNPQHIKELANVLDEMGLSEIKNEWISNLLEDDKQFKNPALNKVVKYKNVNGEDAEGKVGNLLRRPKEEDAYKKAVSTLGGEGSDNYKKAMDDLGGEGQPERDIEGEREKKGEGEPKGEEPQTAAAFDPKTKGGSQYLKGLPDTDPAKPDSMKDDSEETLSAGGVVYPVGGGYYADSPGGAPKYRKATEEGVDKMDFRYILEAESAVGKKVVKKPVDGGGETVSMVVIGDKEKENAEAGIIDAVEREKFGQKNRTYKDAPNGPNQQQMLEDLNNGNLDKITEYQNEVEQSRAAGVAGAGGAVASEGESKYCNACNLEKEQWRADNEEELQSIKDDLANKKRTADEARTAAALGLEPNSPEFLNVLAEAQLFCNQKTAEVKADKNSVLYKKGKQGFADAKVGNKTDPEGAYCEWMKAGYFGSVATAKRLDESKIDTSQPHKVVQSTIELDDAVQAHLEDKYKNAETDEDKAYYKKQLKNFKKFRKYHDTYAIGKDQNDRTAIVSISNKKDSQARDPQNNTTPAQRLRFIKASFGEEIAENVAKVIESGVDKVSNVAAETIRSQSKMVIDDDVVKVCEQDRMASYMAELDEKATDGKHRFSKFLMGNGKDWNSLSTKEKLELMQEYTNSRLYDENGKSRIISKPYEDEDGEVVDGTFYIDDDGNEVGPIKSLGASQIGLPFEPFGKIAIKLGEFGANEETIGIKKTEKDMVTEVHTEVTNELFKADAEEGGYHPEERPDADNGKTTQAYILGTMKAMHIDTYIDMDDDDDDAMLIQMGVNGVKPSMVRKCISEKSGFTGDVTAPEWKKALKEFLLKRSRVTPGGDRVKITDNGKEIELFEDTWRTAGTSQKVASGFGKDMRECLQEKAKLSN